MMLCVINLKTRFKSCFTDNLYMKWADNSLSR